MEEIKSEDIERELELEEIDPREMDSIDSPQAKVSFKNKMMLLAVFGILLGFVIKTEAAKNFTVGFEDYKLAGPDKVYNINKLQEELELRKAIQEEQQATAEAKELEAVQKEAIAEREKTTCDVEGAESCE